MIYDMETMNYCLGLNELAENIHKDNVDRGFYDSPRETGTMLMLIVSELSEALEAYRKDKFVDKNDLEGEFDKEKFKEKVKDTFEDEIADALIRILDMCGHMNIDIAKHVYQKLLSTGRADTSTEERKYSVYFLKILKILNYVHK